MASAVQIDPLNIERIVRRILGSQGAISRQRRINIAWASITKSDIEVGELVANANDNSLVKRTDNNLFRYDNAATRTI